MATQTARILQSSGINANVSAVAVREFGVTSDTEQPVIGTNTGGTKYITTEERLLISTVAPSATTVFRRSLTTIVCDTAAAGASIALDIRNGAQNAGYKALVYVIGPAGRNAVVQHTTGITDTILVNAMREYVWNGSYWTSMDVTVKTMPVGDNTTAPATTAFVNAEITNDRPFEATATNIKMNGTQSVGALGTVPRGDHVHPIDTSRAPTSHASTATTYGLATSANYGHAKLLSTITDGVTDGAPDSNSVFDALALKAPLASPTLTGVPAAPTATAGTSTTQLATTEFVTTADNLKANIASPSFTGTPSLPTGTIGVTQAVDNNTTALATTAFVLAQAANAVPVAPAVTAVIGTSTRFARMDHVHPTNFTATATDIKMNGTQAVGTLVTFPRADHVHPSDTSRAPTAHASSATTYGVASATNYGHTKASAATPLINGTAAVGTDNGLFAREAHVHPTDTTRAPLASPTFTGVPAAPTAATGTNTTQLATTAFVAASIGATGVQKVIMEKSKRVGEIYTLLDQVDPTVWSDVTPDTYLPALCLTSIETYTDISTTNWPDLVPYLRGLKSIFKDGITGQISSPSVTNWAIAANVATLTFANNADTIAFLSALLEDQVQNGGYTNWRTVTLATTIGTITAGTYAITDVNASSRTVSFAFVGSTASGAVTATAEFYAFRIAGSTTTARVWTASGLSLMGANDANGYFVSGGLRRRGFFQGHTFSNAAFGGSGLRGQYSIAGGSTYNIPVLNGIGGEIALTMVSEGINGTPRTAKETHSPALTVHIYLHGGRFL